MYIDIFEDVSGSYLGHWLSIVCRSQQMFWIDGITLDENNQAFS